MVTNSPILDAETRGSFVVMQKKICGPTNIQISICHNLKMEWSCIIAIPKQNPLDSLLVPRLLLQKFTFSNAILRLKLSHNQRKIGDYCMEEFECFNFKLQEQERNKERVWKKWKKKVHLQIKYVMLESCFVQPFVELGIRKVGLGKLFGLP